MKPHASDQSLVGQRTESLPTAPPWQTGRFQSGLAAVTRLPPPLVLEDSPSVLSLGRLAEDGFSFEWKAGSNPVLISIKGEHKC